MESWEKAHKIVEKVRDSGLSKDGLERTLGVVLYHLSNAKTDEGVETLCKFALVISQSETSIDEFLQSMRKVDREREDVK